MENTENLENPEKTDTEELLKPEYEQLLDLIAECTDREFISEFFNCIFTPAERKNVAERWLLVKELKAGKTQREIAKQYNMSLCKITRGSKELQKENSAFKKALSMIEKK